MAPMMEDEEEQQLIVRNSSPSSSAPTLADSGQGKMVSVTVGRVMTTLLNARPKKLRHAISCLRAQPKIVGSIDVSLKQSLWFLHKYVTEAEEKEEYLDQVLVPMIQHMLKIKESKHGSQTMILLNWLFLDESIFQSLARDLVRIISRKDDRYVALGWCILGRHLIEYEKAENNLEIVGIREKHDVILKIFCSCIDHLLFIVRNGSNMQDDFELPTRLAVAAADFILSLTIALTSKDISSSSINEKQKTSAVYSKNQLPTLLPCAVSESKADTLIKEFDSTLGLELKLMLWNNLDALITLVKSLTAWSRKSRSLHANGLERIFKWLQGMRKQYGHFQNEADSGTLKTSCLLLSSCWKYYGILLRLEDQRFTQQCKELLDQYLSGVEFYAGKQSEEPNMSNDSKTETINFFINCLLLLLGRLDNQQFGNVLAEFGSRITEVVMSQLKCDDEEVIDGAIIIFKAVILRTNHILFQKSLDDTGQMDAVLPLLLNLLDEQDTAAKAVVKLVAEYCSICSNSNCLQEILKLCDSTNAAKRRNAVDVIADIVYMSSGSISALSRANWQDVANRLLKCLDNEDWYIQTQASNLIPKIDPPFVLPALVGLSYSLNDKVKLSASTALIALLINHKQKPEVLCMLLDCLSNLCQNPDTSGNPAAIKEGSALDASGLLKLLPEWAKNIEDWNAIAGPLIDKMLAEPSNAVIVRFLSHISEYLATAVELIFDRLILFAKGQKEIDEHSPRLKESTNANGDAMNCEHRLFRHLCPLLVIKLLPLRVFDDLHSTLLYGALPTTSDLEQHFSIDGTESIAALLIYRALSKSEFEDVRRLAAELCGRLHPNLLIPIMSSRLEHAANAKDLSDIKACLFSLCTSLLIMGGRAYEHPDLFRIRKIIHAILHWPSVEKDEISKAQHGCIDCLALMLCSELQDQQSSKLATLENTSIARKGDSVLRGSVIAYAINQLTDDKTNICFQSDKGDKMYGVMAPLSFRLCMANVLISACQKISGTGRKRFVKKILPCVIHAVELDTLESDINAACIQVLFSVVYYLKALILPYSFDLLNVSLKSLRGGSQKEKMAGAKLLTCLMANEEVVESAAEGLLEAQSLLQYLSSTDPSTDVRQMCQQLLVCLTSS